jgi:phospholipid/cholesterol/gamma-HCH transport system permease protein
VAEAARHLVGLLGFFGATWLPSPTSSAGRSASAQCGRQRFDVVGVRALGIIGLMSFLIGIVIAQQGAVQLQQFGAEIYTINLIGRITVRELGTLMTAIMVAGRSGLGLRGAARNDEDHRGNRRDANDRRVADGGAGGPALIATVIMMPLLAFWAMFMSLSRRRDLRLARPWNPAAHLCAAASGGVPITDLWIGLIKAPVFGFIIALAGCFQGMLVEGNAEEVGQRTTTAVVQSIFLVIVLDAVFAVFFSSIGWMMATSASPDCDPIITIRGLRNSFGEQVVHEDLDLDGLPGRDSRRGRRVGHRQVGADALDHRPSDPTRARSRCSART